MRSTRAVLIAKGSLAAILLLVAVIVLWNPFIKSSLGLAAENRAFAHVHVGDTEAKLIDILESYRVDYDKQADGDRTVYTHADGFMGMYFYYVKNGRVVEVGAD